MDTTVGLERLYVVLSWSRLQFYYFWTLFPTKQDERYNEFSDALFNFKGLPWNESVATFEFGQIEGF